MAGELGDLTARLSLQTDQAVSALGDFLEKGKIGFLGLAAGVAGAAAGAADLSSKFDSALASISAKADITKGAAEKIGQAFLSTAGQTTFSATQIAEAFAPVSGQLGQLQGKALDSSQSLAFMDAAMAGAEATGGDLSSTAAGLARTLVAFKEGVSSSTTVMDALTNASRLTNQPVADLTVGVDRLKAKLGDAAPTIEDSATLVVALNNAGLAGNKAINGMSSALEKILDPSKAVKNELHDLGVNVYTANGHFVGMASLIGQLQPKLERMTDQQRDAALTTLFGAQQAQAMNAIIEQGSAAYAQQAQAIGLAGSAQDAAQRATDNFKSKLEEAHAAITDAGISIGNVLLPYLTSAAEWLGQRVPAAINTLRGWISAHQSDLEHWAGVIRNVVVAAFSVLSTVVGDVLSVAQSLGQFVSEHIQVFEALGTTLLALYAGRKAGGFIGGVLDDVTNLYSKFSSLLGLGGGAGGIAGKLGIQHVWVDNLAVGGGVGPGVAGGAAAGEANVVGEGATAGTAERAVSIGTLAAVTIAGAATLVVGTVSLLNAVAPPQPGTPGWQPTPGSRGILGYIPDPAAENRTEHERTYLSQPGQAFDPVKNTGLVNDAMQQYAAEILAERDNLPPKFNELTDEIGRAVVPGSRVHDAMVDLAALTTAGVTTNQSQTTQYLSNWNQIQNGALNTKDAQYKYASMLATGQIKLNTPMNSFIESWNVAQGAGVTFATAQTVVAQAGLLAAKSGNAFAGGINVLAQQTGASASQILSAYTLTATFAQQMAQHQQAIAGLLANLEASVPASVYDRTSGSGSGFIKGSAIGNEFPYGGLSWVGEGGRELVRIPAGGRVIPHADSERIAEGLGGPREIHAGHTFNQYFDASDMAPSDVAVEVGWALRTVAA